ncbi:Lsr2 family protein [Nonomuraea sp. 160415]|uniref:Lsr2 family DNA-binding protein n=1 Tax=Nonomuraea basaltis TaxID=2495887 RepID=UPI00197F0877
MGAPTTDAPPRPSPPRTPAEIARPSDQQPTVSRVRAWAREQGFPVADRGRLRPEIWEACMPPSASCLRRTRDPVRQNVVTRTDATR